MGEAWADMAMGGGHGQASGKLGQWCQWADGVQRQQKRNSAKDSRHDYVIRHVFQKISHRELHLRGEIGLLQPFLEYFANSGLEARLGKQARVPDCTKAHGFPLHGASRAKQHLKWMVLCGR